MSVINHKISKESFIRRKFAAFININLIAIILLSVGNAAFAQTAPRLLTYTEIVQLYKQETPTPALATRLGNILTTPFVVNNQNARVSQKPLSTDPQLGQYLRVAFWNIERGIELPMIKLAFTDPDKFAAKLDVKKYPLNSEARKEIIEQAKILSQADVIILNEADWGVKRSGYYNVTAEIARAVKMNYAYGVEFVEVDPITTGTETFAELAPADRRELRRVTKVDPRRYRGLHGNAILSRYKLENVRLIPFKEQGHDWYAGERAGTSSIEKVKREVGNKVLETKVRREVRRGGRMMMTADIAVGDTPAESITIVATHLEARTKPKERQRQIEELLGNIKDIKNPVIVAGDMNTTNSDLSPTSIGRELKSRLGSPNFWGGMALRSITGAWMFNSLTTGIVKSSIVGIDPTVRSIPVIAPNPSEDFFDQIKKFRFADGKSFDFRGDKTRSVDSRADTLSNSNERASKGFVATSQVDTIAGISVKSKLDWFFIKPSALIDPSDDKQSYRLAPHFGRTLAALNSAFEERISDHHPLTVDLPLNEPIVKTEN
jgi:endonuclease/exonuclease/phosphatase family metal-dependent hydrolase